MSTEEQLTRPGAERRTSLASERTQLAWWRTGLTAIAVALGVGRVLPDLSDSGSRWSYTVVGIAFAIYGIAMIAYGTRRARAVAADLGLPPAYQGSDRVRVALAAAGMVLGAAAAVLILID